MRHIVQGFFFLLIRRPPRATLDRSSAASDVYKRQDTTAYKKEGTTSRTFADEMSLRIKDSSNMGIPKKLGDITYGVHLGQVYTDYSTGNFKVTDNTTDFAIEGNGFFAVAFTDKQGNTSVKYTRDGAFTVNKEGYLVTKDGDYVLNATGAMNGDPGQNNYIRLDPVSYTHLTLSTSDLV